MSAWQRKIIHLDMDCFYAAIEQRDNPELRGKPVGVGGARDRRGVLTTCSYEARPYGVRSAMPTYLALRKCPQLIVVPTRFDVYRRESQRIREIFSSFTGVVEPLSLDEAYLDVSHLEFDPAGVAYEIRERIFEQTGLTASAGIAPNKLLAKIASDVNKPKGQCVVEPDRVAGFMKRLPVRKLWGVGGVSSEKLEKRGIQTCGQLQELSRIELHALFGRFGIELYDLCRGIDKRPVEPHRVRKSMSTEQTFTENLATLAGVRAATRSDLRRFDEGSGKGFEADPQGFCEGEICELYANDGRARGGGAGAGGAECAAGGGVSERERVVGAASGGGGEICGGDGGDGADGSGDPVRGGGIADFGLRIADWERIADC